MALAVQPKQLKQQSLLSRVLYLPFQLLQLAGSLLKPVAPQLVPIAVCLLFIPLVILSSVVAGYVVWKGAAVGWQAPVYLQYGDGRPPYADLVLPILVPQQPYDVSLILHVPSIPANFDLGNFMTTLKLTSPSNETLVLTRKPTIIVHPGSRILLITKVPSVLRVTVPLLDAFTPAHSRVNAMVELGRRDGWKSVGDGHGRELSVLSASLRGTVYNRGIRGLATRFPLASATISSITFLTIALLVLSACLVPTMLSEGPATTGTVPDPNHLVDDPTADKSKLEKGKQAIHPAPREEGRSEEEEEGKPLRRRRGSRTSTEPESVKMEESPVDSSHPLRRRRSRLSHIETHD